MQEALCSGQSVTHANCTHCTQALGLMPTARLRPCWDPPWPVTWEIATHVLLILPLTDAGRGDSAVCGADTLEHHSHHLRPAATPSE